MTINYSYKQLASTDVGLMKKLLKVFGDAFEDVNTYQGAIPSDSYLQSLLGKEHFIAVVVLDESNAVVGGLAAYELQKFERERKEIYIYDLAVLEAHRRRGVATRLINELRRIAKAHGAYVIFVQADRGDMPAIKLYESLGKREDVYHFDIDVK